MALQPLDINKVWFRGTLCDEPDWDNIKDPLEAWAASILRDINQLKLDLFGTTYPFDNDGLPNTAAPLYDYTTHTSALPWIFSNTVQFAGLVAYTGAFGLSDVADDHYYLFTRPFDLAADRNCDLPLLTANDTFVFANHPQTLDNKAINVSGPGVGTANVRYINSANDRDITIPDPGAADTFAMVGFGQTLDNKRVNFAGAGLGTANVEYVNSANDRVYQIPDIGVPAAFVMTEGTQTINGQKTFSSIIPTITGAWTAIGQTCADLGSVTTADINGGTWQGSIDGASNVANGVVFGFNMAGGTAPFTCASNTVVTNLNSDLLDGQHAAAFLTSLPNHGHSAGAGDGGQLDWDVVWADSVHDHSAVGEGGQLDWDVIWADAVHDHSAAGEGGQLDWDTCWADAIHDHSSSAEGSALLNTTTLQAPAFNFSSANHGVWTVATDIGPSIETAYATTVAGATANLFSVTDTSVSIVAYARIWGFKEVAGASSHWLCEDSFCFAYENGGGMTIPVGGTAYNGISSGGTVAHNWTVSVNTLNLSVTDDAGGGMRWFAVVEWWKIT